MAARVRVVDRLVTRVMRLSEPARAYEVERGLRIPLRDGISLSADHYAPAGTPRGTLLVRGPYGRGWPYDLLYARLFAARGYHVLFVSSRGTAASEGDFDPMRTELEDGQDVVAHLIAQPWFTGTFGTVGPSYLGYTQWTLLTDPPPEMAAAVITVGPHDFAEHVWGTGAFNMDMVGWADMVSRLPRSDEPVSPAARIAAVLREPGLRRARQRVYTEVPFADAADRHFAGKAPWFRPRATKPDLSDPFWRPMRHAEALDRATIPILLLTGWQDLFVRQTFEQYTRLHERGVDVALTVGPWTHVETIGKGGALLFQESLDWLDAKLNGSRLDRAPVRIHVTGASEWRDLPSWPPPTVTRSLFLGPAGTLTGSPEAIEACFVFDPARPTPTIGGPLLDGGGYTDDSALATRSDVLSFTTAPLPEALTVIGQPTITLDHRTTVTFADLFIRVSEVDTRNRSRNVTEGYARLPVERDEACLVLLPTAHRFAAGSRLRVLIAGGSSPQFARNLGTDENPGTGSSFVPVEHTVTGGRIELPIQAGQASPGT